MDLTINPMHIAGTYRTNAGCGGNTGNQRFASLNS
jgi:catalase (peroxidase I)